jgi:hypothetical protein
MREAEETSLKGLRRPHGARFPDRLEKRARLAVHNREAMKKDVGRIGTGKFVSGTLHYIPHVP